MIDENAKCPWIRERHLIPKAQEICMIGVWDLIRRGALLVMNVSIECSGFPFQVPPSRLSIIFSSSLQLSIEAPVCWKLLAEMFLGALRVST